MRLPSTLRQKLARDFARVKAQGVSQAGKFLVLGVLRDEALPEFQFGLVTGARLGNAVVRNRIRRRLKEAARLALPGVARDGFDYVLIGREASATRSFEDLQNDIISAVSKLHAAPHAGDTRTRP